MFHILERCLGDTPAGLVAVAKKHLKSFQGLRERMNHTLILQSYCQCSFLFLIFRLVKLYFWQNKRIHLGPGIHDLLWQKMHVLMHNWLPFRTYLFQLKHEDQYYNLVKNVFLVRHHYHQPSNLH